MNEFQVLLDECGMSFSPPPGFVPSEIRNNNVFTYQYAHKPATGGFEIRYRIDSLKRLEQQRKTANERLEVFSSVSLNNMQFIALSTILFNLGGKDLSSNINVFVPEAAGENFGADWAAFCTVSLGSNNGFAPEYDTAVIFNFHKNDVATAFLICTFNDKDFELVQSNYYAKYPTQDGQSGFFKDFCRLKFKN